METLVVTHPQELDSLAAFYQVASQVYRDDPVWVPQSEFVFQQSLQAWQPEGPDFLQPVVIIESGRPLARAVAIMPPSAKDERGRRQGYIAFFECLPGFEQAGCLALQVCEGLLQEKGACTVQAPRLNNLLMGLVVKGFEQPQTVMSPHNPPYYQDILLANGYQLHKTLCSYLFSRRSAISFPLKIPGVCIRTFNRSNLEQEVQIFKYLNDQIFSSHADYVARNLAEERQMIESFLPMLDDDLVIVAETSSGSPLGLLVCVPDIYQRYKGKSIDAARLITIGAIPSMASKGVGVLMSLHLMHNLLAKGYQTLEASWISATNIPPRNLAKRFNGQPNREFALFEKPL